MPGTTPIRGWPFGQLTDNVTDLISVEDLAVAVENDLFASLGLLTAHCCVVYRSSGDGDTGNIADSTVSAVHFPSEIIDTNGYHDSVTNTERITCPTGLGGYYLYGANVRIGGSANGNIREMFIDINGDGLRRAGDLRSVPNNGFAATNVVGLSAVGLDHLNAGDYLQCNILQDSGGGIPVKQTGHSPNFWALRLPTA